MFCVPAFSLGVRRRGVEDHKLELELQLVDQRMIEVHSKLEQLLVHAREACEASRKLAISSVARFVPHFAEHPGCRRLPQAAVSSVVTDTSHQTIYKGCTSTTGARSHRDSA